MESNKYDTDFRTKVNNREITPSADSWNRLEAMLDSAEKKKSKPMTWLFIAAGIVGLLLVGNLFFIGQGNTDNQIQVVEKSDQPSIIERTISEPIKPTLLEESIAASVPNENVKNAPTKKAKVRTPVGQLLEKKVFLNSKESIAIVNAPVQEEKVVKTSIQNEENIEKLLAQARPNEEYNHKVKVDARSLLSQVDGELDLTFREKVVKSATKNYQNIKVAVVNRNYE